MRISLVRLGVTEATRQDSLGWISCAYGGEEIQPFDGAAHLQGSRADFEQLAAQLAGLLAAPPDDRDLEVKIYPTDLDPWVRIG